jgi:predicted DNA-binding WGR domain protein
MGTTVYAEGIPPSGSVSAGDLEALLAAASQAGQDLAWGCEAFCVPGDAVGADKVSIATKIMTTDETHFDRDLGQCVALVACLSKVRPRWTWVLSDDVEALTVDLGAEAIYVRNGRAVASEEADAEHDEAAQEVLAHWRSEVTLAPLSGATPERPRGPGRRFECSEDGASKFWEIHVEGARVATAWGKIGARGQEKVADHASPAAAAKDAEKQVRAKVAKGYVELPAVVRADVPAAVPVLRETPPERVLRETPPEPVEAAPAAASVPPSVTPEVRVVSAPPSIAPPRAREKKGRFLWVVRESVTIDVNGPDSDGEYRVRLAGEIRLDPGLRFDGVYVELELRGAKNEIVFSDHQGVDIAFVRDDHMPFAALFFSKGGPFERAVQAHVYARGRVMDLDGPASFALPGRVVP